MLEDSSVVYLRCLRAEKLQDVWLKHDGEKWVFKTLSGLTKEETKEAIPMIRDFLQGEINDAHGDEWVVIHWSKFENINKPDFELR